MEINERRNTIYLCLEFLSNALAGTKFSKKFEEIRWDICLFKRIPPESGLGGGSANAATLLNAISKALPEIPENIIKQTARSIGADTTFFLYNKPSFWGGIGEIFLAGPYQVEKSPIILIRPPFGSSTVQAYKLFQKKELSWPEIFDLQELNRARVQNFKEPLTEMVFKDFRNDFESHLFSLQKKYLEIIGTIESMIHSGRYLSFAKPRIGITGSGSTIFILLKPGANLTEIKAFKKELKKKWIFTVLTYPFF